MNILKIVIAPYFILGMVTGVACSPRSAWHPGLKGYAILGAIHLLFIIGAPYLLADAKKKGLTFSSSGLRLGLAVAYAAGFIIFYLI